MNPTGRMVICAAGAALAAACASTPVPQEKIAVAQAAVQRAEQAGAPQSAAVEMSTARDKLAQAVKAEADHDNATAQMLADQANVDAQVAEAAAQANTSHKAEQESEANLAALRQATNREAQAPAEIPTANPQSTQ